MGKCHVAKINNTLRIQTAHTKKITFAIMENGIDMPFSVSLSNPSSHPSPQIDRVACAHDVLLGSESLLWVLGSEPILETKLKG